MRPRDLLIEVFRMVCRLNSVVQIYAVRDAHRHHRSSYFGKDVMRSLPLNYDEAWQDRGATEIVDGFAVLPVARSDRREAEIPARKRSLYRKRYMLLDTIEQSLVEQWSQAVSFVQPQVD